MNKARAKAMTGQLVGVTVKDWTIVGFKGAGKSALVFEANNAKGEVFALKIFDPEIIENYGDQQQLVRIEREKFLIGKSHPNLVRIFDGGAWEVGDLTYYFVVMEFVPLDNLADILERIPTDSVWSIISQVASAARFLIENGLCHRDIKPENIVCDSEGKQVKLLDLGVLRPTSGSNLTDEKGRPFVGTLRYSPPEYLLRTEEDTEEGWLSNTFYQLGGVLHDLIMRQPLFQPFTEPFTRLGNAVQNEIPAVFSTSVPPHLVTLAANCLIKNPKSRLQTVSWRDFEIPQSHPTQLDDLKSRMSRKRSSGNDAHALQQKALHKARKLRDFAKELRENIRLNCLDFQVPRFSLVLEDTIEEKEVIKIAAAQSKEESLLVDVHLILEVGWLSAGDDAIEISGGGKLSRSDDSSTDLKANISLYKGAVQMDAVSIKVMHFTLRCFELACQNPLHSENVLFIDSAILQMD